MTTHESHTGPSEAEKPDLRRARIMTIPNALTIARVGLTLPFLYLIGKGSFGIALLIFFIASVTDFFDGYLARRLSQESSLGQFLDPLADKLLTTAGFVILALPRAGIPSMPAWLAIAVVARDLVILAGSLILNRLTGISDFKPTLSGKVNTFLELGLIVFFLGFHTWGRFIFLLPLCYLIVLASIVISGISYLIIGFKMLRGSGRPDDPHTPGSA